MICCDVEIGNCSTCGQNALVHLERIDVYHTGFGCVNCGTAEKKGDVYVAKENEITTQTK